MLNFSNQLLELQTKFTKIFTFIFSYIIFLMMAICRIEDEIGLITSAGPEIFFLLTTTF
jgi:hypothetical protein